MKANWWGREGVSLARVVARLPVHVTRLHKMFIYIFINVFIFSTPGVLHGRYYGTREIPAFGVISLALRWSGALGATFGRLRHPRWETAAFGGGERQK